MSLIPISQEGDGMAIKTGPGGRAEQLFPKDRHSAQLSRPTSLGIETRQSGKATITCTCALAVR